MKDADFSMRALWERGMPDEAIAYILGTHANHIRRWREKNHLCSNPKSLRSAEELAGMLPKVGDRLKKRPTTDKEYTEFQTTPLLPCRVIHVNREHLHYTVRFDDYPWLTESYRVI